MNTKPAASEDARGIEPDDESEHEKHRRLKNEQERLFRKQLTHLRPVELDELEDGGARPPRFKD